MLRPSGVVLLFCGLFALAACAAGPSEAFERSFYAAKRAYAAGRYEEAARLYEEAAEDASRVKDRDEATFMQARMYEKLERWPDAQDTYRRLEELSPRGPRAGRASYEQAEIEIDHGDAAKGWRALAEALRAHPDHGSARRALSRWCRHHGEEQGEEALRERLGRWLRELRGTDIEQQLKYEMGWSWRRSGDLQRAHAQLLTTARDHPYPHGTLTDDALWHASHVAEELGDYPLAVADLRELLSTREQADGGSYERPRYPGAQLRIGELYRDRLGDLDQARRELRRMYTVHSTSVLADDAMWADAVLALRQGHTEEVCELARDLPQRFPGSRYRACLRQLCPSAEPPARPCPDYILRTLRPRDLENGDQGDEAEGDEVQGRARG